MLAHVGQRAVGRGAEVDGGLTATGGRRPAGPEELLARGHEVVGAAARALGVEDQDVGPLRHQVDQQLHLVDERGGEGLHPLDRDARRHLVEQLAQLRVRLAELGGAGADLLGEQQLAARRGPEPLDGLQGALVGDREAADLLDLVAPQLDAHGVLGGRWEDVEDPAAHGELAALLDEVDALVGGVGETAYEVLEGRLVADGDLDRLELSEPLDLGLEHGAHGCDDDPERTRAGLVAGVAEPTQHREATPDRVAARAEPLVGQGLPGGVLRDQLGVEEGAERGDEILGLPRGRGDREHAATRAHEAGHDEGTQRLGPGELTGADAGGARVVEDGGEDGLGQDGLGQAGEGHGAGALLSGDGQAGRRGGADASKPPGRWPRG